MLEGDKGTHGRYEGKIQRFLLLLDASGSGEEIREKRKRFKVMYK